jgi:hypothetical protein
MILPYGRIFEDDYDISSFLQNIPWTDEAHFTLDGVFSTHMSHQLSWDDPHSIRERGYQFHFYISFWPGIVETLSWAPACCLLNPHRCNILEPVVLGLHEAMLAALRSSSTP